jgi:cyclic pyranopterin phosphate synthase
VPEKSDGPGVPARRPEDGAPDAAGAEVANGAQGAAGASPDEPRDTLGRPLRDLRVSVTDRCNFRCVYCMPKEVYGADFAFLPRAEILTFEEIARLVRLFVDLGVDKVRLTGGEPLMRRGLERLVTMLAAIPGLRDLAMTTNGSLLAARARSLRDAGLQRVTVSLDALDDTTFMAMNDVHFPVARVLEAVEAAGAAGLSPVKVNAVIKRGVNEHAIVDLARHFRGSGAVVRFIEFMDVGRTNGWRLDDVVPAAEVVRRIAAEWPLEPVAPARPGEVAARYRYRDGAGEVGVIASVTQPFCRGCVRARLSADGQLYTCLFAARGHDLRTPLRQGADDTELAARLRDIWGRRHDRYSELRSAETPELPRSRIEMSYIGG